MNSATRASSGKGKTGKAADAGKTVSAGKTADIKKTADASAGNADKAGTAKAARTAKASKAVNTAKAAKANADTTVKAVKTGDTDKVSDTAAARAGAADNTAKTSDAADTGKTGKAAKASKAATIANAANADKAADTSKAAPTDKTVNVDSADNAGKAAAADKAGKSDAAKAAAADNTAKAGDAGKTGKDAKAADTANAASAGKTSGVTDTAQADTAADTAAGKDVKTAAADTASDAETAGKSDAADTAKAVKAVKAAKTGKGDVAVIVALGDAEEAAEMLKCLESQTLQPKKTVFALAADAEQGRALQKMLDASKLSHTELLCDEKLRGEAGCWNEGAACAGECEHLYFLKAGYMPDACFLQRAAERLHGNSAAVAASADYLREHEDRQTLESGAGPEQEGPLWLFQNGADLVPRTLFRGAAYRSFYGFNLEAGNARDFEFCLLIAKQGDWLYAADCAVRAVEDEYARSADADDERDRDYALLCEMYFDNFDFRGRIPKTVYRALFARKWHRAAQWMLAVGRFTDARDCLRRSLAWKILGNPALWRLTVMPAYKSTLLRRRLETARRKLSAGQSPLPAPASRF